MRGSCSWWALSRGANVSGRLARPRLAVQRFSMDHVHAPPHSAVTHRSLHGAKLHARFTDQHRPREGHEISFQHANSQRIALLLACTRLLPVSAARTAGRDDDMCLVEFSCSAQRPPNGGAKSYVCALFVAPRWWESSICAGLSTARGVYERWWKEEEDWDKIKSRDPAPTPRSRSLPACTPGMLAIGSIVGRAAAGGRICKAVCARESEPRARDGRRDKPGARLGASVGRHLDFGSQAAGSTNSFPHCSMSRTANNLVA